MWYDVQDKSFEESLKIWAIQACLGPVVENA